MFRTLLFSFFIFCSFAQQAQNSLVVLSSAGEEFYLFINGNKINEKPQSIVKKTNLHTDTCGLKILFENKKLPELIEKAYLLKDGKSCKNTEFTYSVEKVKNKNSLVFVSSIVFDEDSLNRLPVSSFIRNAYENSIRDSIEKEKYSEHYPAPRPCTYNVSDSLLEAHYKTFKDNHIEITRMKDAKWFISNKCLNTDQLKKILLTFDYEDSKLKLAEFSYDYLFDKQNFMRLADALNYPREKGYLKTFYKEKTNEK